ncbi:hypothetical protein GE061_003628 [Apolygus lucorum]|uniref:Uncharacterized protein n=1 Tax=Apolygus lucorum TaxID=248454 RepID=A0A6A4JP49_APOLU|nr:hypothetical protein GE061_003628 [Apolygus lucorum]
MMDNERSCNYISRMGDLPIYIRRGEHPDRERPEGVAAAVNQREERRSDVVPPGDPEVSGWLSSDFIDGESSSDDMAVATLD